MDTPIEGGLNALYPVGMPSLVHIYEHCGRWLLMGACRDVISPDYHVNWNNSQNNQGRYIAFAYNSVYKYTYHSYCVYITHLFAVGTSA